MNVEDFNACENFDKTTKFEDGRYEVSLPFREEHEAIGDNFAVTKNRLKRLTLHSRKIKTCLLHECDRTIKGKNNIDMIEQIPGDDYGTTGKFVPFATQTGYS